MVRAIGRVKSKFGHHILIVECDAAKLPRLYSKVLDKRWKPVGKLIDIFGNVNSPYAAVLTNSEEPSRLIGEKLFIK
ncbi:H/ACA ribonucleoprotein complex subunit GAR1 [Methanospirillum purgamenti]|uniref:H/ACA ribonucleoprotein complex subunit GAR1 n=1 Tax=Methanospirillum purgamenti TaxID=2834276 RepID=UPI0020288F45|nr:MULTISPECIES: Gar1/Naf1 family protein [Methanospirillum]MDX8549591.1 Gar1/Naf1 family protein [Methanospirillum hungatei]